MEVAVMMVKSSTFTLCSHREGPFRSFEIFLQVSSWTCMKLQEMYGKHG